jgi:hypothetical protein
VSGVVRQACVKPMGVGLVSLGLELDADRYASRTDRYRPRERLGCWAHTCNEGGQGPAILTAPTELTPAWLSRWWHGCVGAVRVALGLEGDDRGC